VWIEKIRDDDREALLPRAGREPGKDLAQIRGALGFHSLEQFEDAEDAALATARLRLVAKFHVERKNGHAIEVRQADVTQGRGDPPRLIELPGLAHRLAAVDEEIDRQVLLFVEQPEQQPAQPLVGLPVDVAEIVTGRIPAMVGELQPAAALGRQPIRAVLPANARLDTTCRYSSFSGNRLQTAGARL
jgi:hypothetical protein